jgi:anaerobic magnesium-protoporphyrin IX monomethyl ester cyclase
MLKRHRKVLLLSPPNSFLENRRSVPRLGLLYLGTILRRGEHAVTIRHLNSLRELDGLATGAEFDFVGISATTREYLDAVQILNYFKREQHPAVVAIGGPHATALPEECLHNGFDLVVAGETDHDIDRLVGECPNQPRILRCSPVADLDRLPFPDRSLLDDADVWQPFLCTGQEPGLHTASILLSRGCPYRCAFCGPHSRYRRRSDTNIAAELRMLQAQGYEGLVILDDLPFVNRQQVRGFCDAIRPLQMKFRCNFRPDLLTDEIVRMLADAGCCRIQLGIESASQTVLDAVCKGTRTDRNGQAIALCRQHGIQTKAMFIWGLPGDGPETAPAIVFWVKRYRPDAIQLSSFAPLPGSPLWQRGFHRRVTDYCALSFFGGGSLNSAGSGVGNNRYTAQELWQMREAILTEIAPFARVDLGLACDTAPAEASVR